MRLFDSHAHLDDEKFDEDREQVIDSLKDLGVCLVMNASSDLKTSEKSLELADRYPFIYAAAGIHPHETENVTEDDMDRLASLLDRPKCMALGEIGLDYYYDSSIKDIQTKWFRRQLELAAELDVPVIIHDREAHQECFDAVKHYGVKGVFHCYSGSPEMAKELVRLGFCISFTGALTFKNARKAVDTVREIPFDRLMIETDCPYMAPEPFRGTRNFPGLVIHTCRKMAEIKGETPEKTAEITCENAMRLFRIS